MSSFFVGTGLAVVAGFAAVIGADPVALVAALARPVGSVDGDALTIEGDRAGSARRGSSAEGATVTLIVAVTLGRAATTASFEDASDAVEGTSG